MTGSVGTVTIKPRNDIECRLVMKNYLQLFRIFVCVALVSFCTVGYVNAQSIRRAPAPAPQVMPAPAAEPAPAPAPPMP